MTLVLFLSIVTLYLSVFTALLFLILTFKLAILLTHLVGLRKSL